MALFDETILGFVGNLKGFRSEGSTRVPRGRTFLDFVDLFNRFFRLGNSFASFWTSTKRFGGFGEKPIFFECLSIRLVCHRNNGFTDNEANEDVLEANLLTFGRI